jgi:hypothetical protein
MLRPCERYGANTRGRAGATTYVYSPRDGQPTVVLKRNDVRRVGCLQAAGRLPDLAFPVPRYLHIVRLDQLRHHVNQ